MFPTREIPDPKVVRLADVFCRYYMGVPLLVWLNLLHKQGMKLPLEFLELYAYHGALVLEHQTQVQE